MIERFPVQFIGLIYLLNFTSGVLWLVVEKNYYLLNFDSMLLAKIRSSLSTKRPTGQTNNENKKHASGSKPTTEQPINNKGWDVDDTASLQVDLLTIEDIIFPITLKNEHEKSIKDLIIHIRRLSRVNNDKTDQSKRNENLLPSYLNVFFDKLQINAVRSIFLKSLYILLEDYSRKDSRVLPYLEKLSPITQQQLL
jgi:hypothetical protein